MKREYKIWLIVIGFLMVIFTFTDLKISHAIYNPESKFGLIFEAVGEFPAAIIATFCTIGLMLTRNKEKSAKYILGTIGYIMLLLLVSLMSAALPVKYFNGPELLIPILAIIYIGASYFIAKKISVSNKEELRNAAIVGVLTFVFVVIAFNLIKLAWGRERYRHMIEVGSFDAFSMWFIPQGLASGNEFMSFPSGHSANAAIMVWIALIPTFVPSLKDKKKWFIAFAAIWTVLVPVSRVFLGAHFASDVTMGVTITLVIFTLLKSKYVNNSEIKNLGVKDLDDEMKKSVCLHDYMIKKSIINFWLVNAVINAVIFIFQISDKTRMFTTSQIALDYVISILILGMACALTGFPMIKKDIVKGTSPKIDYNKENHIIVKWFPRNNFLKSIIITGITLVLIIPFFVGIPAMFGIVQLTFMQALILKTIATGFAGVVVGYFVMVLTLTENKSLADSKINLAR